MMDPNMQQVPPGALPNEMADDVPINASEGEYIIPADVVRFIGLDKIEKMVTQAKEKLVEMDGAGRIGGEDPMEQPPMPAEPVMGEQMPVGMAEGGMVTQPQPQKQGVFEFIGPDGSSMWVPFFNGQPLTEVPQGFQEASQRTMPEQTPQPQAPQPTPRISPEQLNELSEVQQVNEAFGQQQPTMRNDASLTMGQQPQPQTEVPPMMKKGGLVKRRTTQY